MIVRGSLCPDVTVGGCVCVCPDMIVRGSLCPDVTVGGCVCVCVLT